MAAKWGENTKRHLLGHAHEKMLYTNTKYAAMHTGENLGSLPTTEKNKLKNPATDDRDMGRYVGRAESKGLRETY